MGFFGNIFKNSASNAPIHTPKELEAKQRGTSISEFLRVNSPQAAAYSNINVNPKSSLKSTIVYACVNVIGNAVSTLNWSVYKTQGSRRLKDKDHPTYNLVNKEPYKFYTSPNFYKALTVNFLLRGNGYAEIKRNGRGIVTGLKLVNPDNVEVVCEELEGEDILKYRLIDSGRVIDYKDMIHISDLSLDGIQGLSRISLARQNVEYAIRGIKNANQHLKDGIFLGGVITNDEEITEELAKQMRETFMDVYGGKAGQVAVLGSGSNFTPFSHSMTYADAQFVEMMNFSKNDICSLFGVQPHKVQLLERSTNNNIEMQNIEFAVDTVRPIVVLIESEMTRKLFTSREPDNYVKANLNSLMRGDAESRAKFFESMVKIRAMSPNKVLEIEDMNPIEGGDMIAWGLDEIPQEIVMEYYNSIMQSKTKENGS